MTKKAFLNRYWYNHLLPDKDVNIIAFDLNLAGRPDDEEYIILDIFDKRYKEILKKHPKQRDLR